MKILLHILLFFLTSTLFGQELKPETIRLVKKLIEVNVLHHKHVGNAGQTTEQYYNFLKLRDNATTAELISLLDNSNSVIKGYASWSLADNKYPGLDKVLFRFLESKELVKTFNGCIVSRDDLASELYYRVVYQHYENNISRKDSIFFAKQIKKLDSVILYHFENCSLFEQALLHNNANPANYERIKELAFQDKNKQAIIELAKYNNTNDIDGLKKLGRESFQAISYFPNERFWSFLENYFDKEKSADLFMAVASFKSDKANEALSTFFTQLANSHDTALIDNLDRALIKHYCSHYQGLLLTIWEKYKFIDISATRKLIADNPLKASEGFTKGLLNSIPFKFIVSDYEFEFKDSILPLMLKTISTYQNDKLFDICSNNIKNTEFTDLDIFLKFVRKNRIGGLESLLVNKLAQQHTAFDIYQLTETILSYNKPDLKQQAIEILKSNRKSWDWGNWSKHFQKLFKTYNIKV